MNRTFQTKVTGEPQAVVKWSVNDKASEDIENVNTWKSGEEYFIKITRATAMQTGNVKVSSRTIDILGAIEISNCSGCG